MDTVLFNVPSHATITPWVDPVVDQHGHDPRSSYVERFWLGVIGPTATWIMRRLADGFDAEPGGYRVDLEHMAVAMGLSFTKGGASPFGKADGLAVRRRLPQVAARHLRRLPDDLQAEHLEWARMTLRLDARDLEQRLLQAGIPPRAVPRATEAVLRAS
jgi:hypothetical protein